MKISQPEQEIKSSSKNRRYSCSAYEVYIRTLKDQITSLEENKSTLKRIIESKNKVISDLQREKANPEVMKCRKDEIHEVYLKYIFILISCPL